jgi:hypothetical protein
VPTATVIDEYVDVAHAFFDKKDAKIRQRLARCRGEGKAGLVLNIFKAVSSPT